MSLLSGALQPNERLLIDRRRRNQTQTEAAKRYRTTPKRYRAWEAGEEAITVQIKTSVPTDAQDLPLYEQCVVARTRRGWNMQTLIRRSGLSRYWVQQVERGRGNPDTLVKFWLNEG